MNKTALFLGRFQPLHNGHLGVIRQLASSHALVKIGIGSAQHGNTHRMAGDNPFSSEERKEMIESTMKDEGIGNYKIYFIPDVPEDEKWVQHVRKITGKFDVAYSGNPLVIKLFEEKNIPVEKINLIEPYNGTKIRELLYEGKSVKELVPKGVYVFLDEKQ